MCQKVEDMILQDCHVNVSVIAHELGISAGTVSSIVHSVLMMSKVVPDGCHERCLLSRNYVVSNLVKRI